MFSRPDEPKLAGRVVGETLKLDWRGHGTLGARGIVRDAVVARYDERIASGDVGELVAAGRQRIGLGDQLRAWDDAWVLALVQLDRRSDDAGGKGEDDERLEHGRGRFDAVEISSGVWAEVQ